MLTTSSLFDLPHPVKGNTRFPLLPPPPEPPEVFPCAQVNTVPKPNAEALRSMGSPPPSAPGTSGGYVACQWDLGQHSDKRAYWIEVFRSHFVSLEQEAIDEAVDRGESEAVIQSKLARARQWFMDYLDQIQVNPTRFGTLYIIDICYAREKALREAGIADPYRLAKFKENQAALKLLPNLLAELDDLSDPKRAGQVMRGTFAGNIYDLGAAHTLELFKNGQSVDFHSIREQLSPRPWLVDGLDAWINQITSPKPYQAAVVFVDNAGCDVVLGMIPMVRDLLQRGVKVLLTANSYPTLNDITHAELVPIVNGIAQWDQTIRQALAQKNLRLVASGNGVPPIDLACVSPELADAVNQWEVDLVILQGMGRAIESNLNAQFTCDSLNIAMIKDTCIANSLGGKVYDLLCKFQQV